MDTYLLIPYPPCPSPDHHTSTNSDNSDNNDSNDNSDNSDTAHVYR